MITDWCVLVTPDVLAALSEAEAGWGWLDLAVSKPDRLVGIAKYSAGSATSPVSLGGRLFGLPVSHPLRNADVVKNSAVWYRGRLDADIWALYEFLAHRPGGAIPTPLLQSLVAQGWRQPPSHGFTALIEDRSADGSRWTAWQINADRVVPANVIGYDPAQDPSTIFDGLWPRHLTRNASVGIVGVGSIGSVSAEAIADYDLGALTLIDYDRILPHNVARHRTGPGDVGRFKVDAVRDRLRISHPTLKVTPRRWDVIEDADALRAELQGIDLVICTADGVAARQATAHLCAQADTHAVFAAVLDDGAYGEVIRSPRGRNQGCLQCLRRHMAATSAIDPEPSLDAGYGTGQANRPMTAITGDLAFVGQLAAKAAISTLLEQSGHRDQRWFADHIIVGLRPAGDAAAPFDQDRVLQITHGELPFADPDCPICAGDTNFS